MSEAPFSPFDCRAMARALELAALGLQTTHPNPRVGCVIACGERIIGEGWHVRAGEPHAEVHALRAAGAAAFGATAYVTLEPCSHHGRTPPCAQALLDAGIGRVVFAVGDPNPRVNGGGARRLREGGVTVQSGLLQAEAAELNVGFLKRMRTGRPWVRVKLAMSLDGRTALADGQSHWITGPAARQDVQHWRARSGAVLTGIGTLLADDPRLDVRLPDPPGGARPPQLRVVLDSQLRTPPEARLFSIPGPVLVAGRVPPPAEAQAFARRRTALEVHAAVETLPASAGGRIALEAVLEDLGRREINELWVEAGPTLAGALLADGWADELILYVAPRLLGPQGRPLVHLPALERLQDSAWFDIIASEPIGADLRLRLRPRPPFQEDP
ncbi:MAG: bifunctional diaminohydroxyphosphoribosylaminopyrimidine deaminase/5-amino-6-(5-phosphoribosylamino)uracil reductase RibD [Steroidobacteraceae bacterium]